jgi:hypothetical protein
VRIQKSARFEQESLELLGEDRLKPILEGLEWMLLRSATTGQKVRGTEIRAWPLFPGDGYVYLAFYRIEDDVVRLESLIKRPVPISPRVLDLED